jgi:penicillin-binding protein 1C
MRRVSGVTGAGPLFQSILRAVGPGGAFAPSPSLEAATVCPASGRRPNAHCPNPRREHFLSGTAPFDTCAVHRRVAIDRRTGQRAHAQTPESAVDERLFAVHPPRYHDWMRRHNVPLPPPASATQTPTRTAAAPQRSPRQLLQSQPPRITYPTPGLQFMMDPVLRADHQQIRPRATVPPEWRDAYWTVNGTRLAGPWAKARWPLAPGVHTIRLHAAPPSGPSAPVDSVRIRVLDVK